MTAKKNPKGKRGHGRGSGGSRNPDGSFKSKLLAKQQELLKTKLQSRIDQRGAPVTRSVGPMSTTTVFSLTASIINELVTEMNTAASLYCNTGAVCNHQRKNLCCVRDVTIAFNTLTETAETTLANKAQKAADKVDRLRTRRFRQEVAARSETAARRAARAKKLIARAVLDEANDWITKVTCSSSSHHDT
jgi:ElaB/YqjD/DUF883 family membrane-anchored ribosome-binding protein